MAQSMIDHIVAVILSVAMIAVFLWGMSSPRQGVMGQAVQTCVHGLALRRDGAPLAGVKVAFILEGRFIGQKVTNDSGAFMFCVNASPGAECALVSTPPQGWWTGDILAPREVTNVVVEGDQATFRLTGQAPGDFHFVFVESPVAQTRTAEPKASATVSVTPTWTKTPTVTPPMPPTETPTIAEANTRIATPTRKPTPHFFQLTYADALSIEDEARARIGLELEPLYQVVTDSLYYLAGEFGFGAQIAPAFEYWARDGQWYRVMTFCEAMVIEPVNGTTEYAILEWGRHWNFQGER